MYVETPQFDDFGRGPSLFYCRLNLLHLSPPLTFSEDRQTLLGLYSETGFHIGMDRNCVCLWRRHNCRSQVIDLSLSALLSWFMKSIIKFLNNYNLHAVISTSVIIYLQWVKKIYFAVLEEIYNNVVPHWSAILQSFNYSLISFIKNASNQRSILSVYEPCS